MSEPSKPREWTPEDWKNLAEAARPLLDEWLKFQKDKEEALTRRMDLIGRHNRRLYSSLIVFLLVVVAGMSALTFYGKVSGDALLFLIGTGSFAFLLVLTSNHLPLSNPERAATKRRRRLRHGFGK